MSKNKAKEMELIELGKKLSKSQSKDALVKLLLVRASELKENERKDERELCSFLSRGIIPGAAHPAHYGRSRGDKNARRVSRWASLAWENGHFWSRIEECRGM